MADCVVIWEADYIDADGMEVRSRFRLSEWKLDGESRSNDLRAPKVTIIIEEE